MTRFFLENESLQNIQLSK